MTNRSTGEESMNGEGSDPVRTADTALDEVVTAIAGRTPWELARMRLRRDKITMTMLGIVLFAILLAIVAPILQSLGVLKPGAGNIDSLDNSGYPSGAWGGTSWSHPLGLVPGSGADLMSRLILGVTFSLTIAFLATCIAILLGTVIGIVSGFRGGVVDFWISRLIDMVLSFPQTLMLLALSGTFIAVIAKVYGDPNQGNLSKGTYIVLVLGLFGWPAFARVIRGLVLSMREREFVESAKSLGAKNVRIYFKELLPNLWAPVLVYFTLIMPTNISAEAALSYLGVGMEPSTPTLGNILTDSVQYAQGDFAYFIYPTLFIAILVLSFNLLGDGLRDALDPKADR